MMYHQTKFARKRISSSELKQSYFNYVNLHYHLDHEVSPPVFPHDTPAHDAPQNHVWLEKVEQYYSDKIQTHQQMAQQAQ